MTDIWVQDLPRAVGTTGSRRNGGSGALIMMPEVSVVRCGSPAACFWTTMPNLDQTAATGPRSSSLPPPVAAFAGRNGPDTIASASASSGNGRGRDVLRGTVIARVGRTSGTSRSLGSSRLVRQHFRSVGRLVWRVAWRLYGHCALRVSAFRRRTGRRLRYAGTSSTSRPPENPPLALDRRRRHRHRYRHRHRRSRRRVLVCRSNDLPWFD